MSVPLEPNTGRAGARSNNECRARDGYDCSRGRVLMNPLFLVFTFPLLGFLTLALSRTRISENAAAAIGVGSIGLSALLTAIIGWQFYQLPGGESYPQEIGKGSGRERGGQ